MSLIAFCLLSSAIKQDSPVEIPKAELPKAAVCMVCRANGSGEAEEKPVAGVRFKGKEFYFCNKSEVEVFKQNPNLYIPLVLPMKLPSLNLTDFSGKVWNAEAFAGRLVLVDYWATWCKPCLAMKPGLDKIRDKYKGQGFEILSVNIDVKKEACTKFLEKNKWANPVAWDSQKTWAPLKVVAIPALFLVKDGQIVDEFRGSADLKQIEAAVQLRIKE